MDLEEILQAEIEKIIDRYLDKYNLDKETEGHIYMIKANLYLGINEKFYELRKKLKEFTS